MARPARPYHALAGVIAAGSALAVTELVGVVVGPDRPAPIGSVATRAVDIGAGSLKDIAIGLFGTNDKDALIVGIVVVSLMLGAGVGLAAARHAWVGPASFAVAASVGVVAAWSDPQASVLAATVACGLGAVAATVALAALLRLSPAPVTAVAPVEAVEPAASAPSLPDPRVKTADRRTFFAVAGGIGLAAAVGALASRGLRGTSRAAASRDATVLPPPVQTVAVPPSQPITVDGLSPYVTPNDDF